MVNWGDLLTTLCSTAILVAALGYVAKTIIGHFFNRDLEKHKTNLKQAADLELSDAKARTERELVEARARIDRELVKIKERSDAELLAQKSEFDRQMVRHMLTHRVPFDMSIFAAEEKAHQNRRLKSLSSAARQMGFQLTPLAA